MQFSPLRSVEAEQPHSGNPLPNQQKETQAKETQEKRKRWNKEKPTEKTKEAGFRRESLFHDYGKRTRHRGIKGRLNYILHSSGALTRSH